MLNRVVLIGRLAQDPELRYTSNGTPVCNFTLAVERNFTNRQGEREADFIDIVAWRRLAETCAEHLGKGRMVGVDGRLQIRKSQKGERTFINPEVVAENVRFLDWPSDGKQSGRQKTNRQEPPQAKDTPEPQDPMDTEDIDEDFDVPF